MMDFLDREQQQLDALARVRAEIDLTPTTRSTLLEK
jgi:hypothetical protein